MLNLRMLNVQQGCPFCGSTDLEITEAKHGRRAVRCKECEAVGPRADNAALAWSLWNAALHYPQGADGIDITPDDVVYDCRTGAQVRVCNIVYGGENSWLIETYDEREFCPEQLTHEEPTSWETLRRELVDLFLRDDIEDLTEETTAFIEKVRAFAEKRSDAQE